MKGSMIEKRILFYMETMPLNEYSKRYGSGKEFGTVLETIGEVNGLLIKGVVYLGRDTTLCDDHRWFGYDEAITENHPGFAVTIEANDRSRNQITLDWRT